MFNSQLFDVGGLEFITEQHNGDNPSDEQPGIPKSNE
jgi:hypothetical protein